MTVTCGIFALTNMSRPARGFNLFNLYDEMNDTITALATPPGEGGISIIRLVEKMLFPLGRLCFIRNQNRKPGSTCSKSFARGNT
ncbi:MAG: hypothetical protein CM1200mP16_00950 [Nitrospina sp.]|nr:MAG: hypothetical protein CM1200mP16_00950 [Nitrospina sp.]